MIIGQSNAKDTTNNSKTRQAPSPAPGLQMEGAQQRPTKEKRWRYVQRSAVGQTSLRPSDYKTTTEESLCFLNIKHQTTLRSTSHSSSQKQSIFLFSRSIAQSSSNSYLTSFLSPNSKSVASSIRKPLLTMPLPSTIYQGHKVTYFYDHNGKRRKIYFERSGDKIILTVNPEAAETVDRARFDDFYNAVLSLGVPWEESGMRPAWKYLSGGT